VCDAGGGTVVSNITHFLLLMEILDFADEYLQDLISYTIEQVDPLKLFMCSESTGERIPSH
jgi:repressor of nif and glnA expression